MSPMFICLALTLIICAALVVILVAVRGPAARKMHVAVALIIFLWFFASWIGGGIHDASYRASAGKVEDGRYFVGNSGHYRQVTQLQFERDLAWSEWIKWSSAGSVGSFFFSIVFYQWWSQRQTRAPERAKPRLSSSAASDTRPS